MDNDTLNLVMYAMAVERMRVLQQKLGSVFTGTELAMMREAEREVDRLTALYLFPSPVVVSGKGGA